ncbi:MAG: phosphotransferase [Burkholderiaceae bacterium]
MNPTEPDPRRVALERWLSATEAAADLDPASLRPASNDASFRRYFRIDARAPGAPSRIVMDAPPTHENTHAFAEVAAILAAAGARVPTIHAHDPDQGFMLLTDFGARTLLAELQENPASADARYRQAGAQLVALQAGADASTLAPYDHERLLVELQLFDHWYLDRHLGRPASDNDMQRLRGCYHRLIEAALAQPVVCVHRDYHSRNLMCVDALGLGVLDFQDALRGPVTYDLVSLLRDAYIAWPEERTLDWAIRYWEAARRAGLPVAGDFGEFYRQFEWMGIQRLLKVLGIFARLHHRDDKPAYLADMPRVLGHLRPMLRRYSEFAFVERLLAERLGDQATAGYTF